MRIQPMNLWDFDGYKVISTNLGWRRDGTNVMGRGVAQQAAARYPALAREYGQWCQDRQIGGPGSFLYYYKDLILVPVKKLNVKQPYLSWQQPASLSLIEVVVQELAGSYPGEEIALPALGCGNGQLSHAQVIPVLEKHLDDRFILVNQPVY